MNSVTININHLGAIANSKIEVRPFLIFTGESGLGKSYAAFLAHYIFAFLGTDRLSHFFDNYLSIEKLLSAQDEEVVLSIDTDEIFSWINRDAIAYIGYMIGHPIFKGDVEIIWPNTPKRFVFRFHEEIFGIANKEEVFHRISSENYSFTLPYNEEQEKNKIENFINAFQTLIRAELYRGIYGDFKSFVKEYVLPPSRGALMELNERPAFMSGMYNEFFNFKADLVRPSKRMREEDKVLKTLLQRLITGDLRQVSGTILYTTSNGVLMPLTAAASSVKELAPFSMLITKYDLSNTSILFEEPEAHLHPQRQNFVADLLAFALNKGCSLQITTHSDYFIKRLNLLVKLFTLRNGDPAFEELIDKYGLFNETLIDPAQISAYVLRGNGDGTSRIEPLDVVANSGIPFDSFHQTILEGLDAQDDIENYQDHNER